MKTKHPSEPASPIEPNPTSVQPSAASPAFLNAPIESIAIPPEVMEFVNYDTQCDELSRLIEDADKLCGEAQTALDEMLKTADLRDEKTVFKLSVLHAQVALAPLRSLTLNAQIDLLSEPVRVARETARQGCLELLGKVLTTNIEILAYKVSAHFASMDDARAAVEKSDSVRQWKEVIEELRWNKPSARRLLEMAQQACEELTRANAEMAIVNASRKPAAESAPPAGK
jgi:hypothetical protein